MSRVITSKAVAYLTPYRPADFNPATFDDPSELQFCAEGDDAIPDGWVRVGSATITAELTDAADIVAGQVQALHVQLERHRAEAQEKENAILSAISNLLALPCEVAP